MNEDVMQNIDVSFLLQVIKERANMSLGDVLEQKEAMTRKDILAKHKYKITLNKDGRYSTYLPDDSKTSKRRKVVKPTLELLENEIVKYYQIKEKESSLENVTLEKFFPEWFQFKSLHTKSTAYMKTITELWNKYYVEDNIITIPISKLTKYTLDTWAHTIITTNNLSKKQYYNMAIIMRQSLDLAVDMEIIKENPFQRVKIDSKLFRIVKKKSDESQVFLIPEQPEIELEAYQDFEETQESACLGIPFLFQTGLRISEIVALKWSDIGEEKENCIHVQRMEVRQYSRNGDKWSAPKRIVVERTKSYAGNRNVYLTSKAREILESIKQNNKEKGYDSEYIFLNKKGRITSLCIDTRIRKYCRHIGIMEKGSHKARKTYISTLIDNENISINYIREQVGHTDERTTYGNYCFNRKTVDRTALDMEDALVKHK